jgi:hypothetical protein
MAVACILLASGISILWGYSIGQSAYGLSDFKTVYFGTRCLLQGHNPYKVSMLNGASHSTGGECPLETTEARQAVEKYVHVPTAFIFVTPFALLPWGPAHLLWLALSAGVFTLAAFLMWDIGARYAPKVSLLLICILLANCEMIFGGGNTAGIVVGLCVVSVWCFLEKRFELVGVLCLALSLTIKPHDAGLVWLYFLLAGGVSRKRALQTLLITAVLGLSAFLWHSHLSPEWMQEWSHNLSATSASGGTSDPGPTSFAAHKASMVIDLQGPISVFRNDPRIYNPVSYLVCGALLLVWSVRTLKLRSSQSGAWFALAAVVPLTMLVTYHHTWDAKLLMLAVPACSILWTERGRTGWAALLLTSAGIILTGDIPLSILLILVKNLHLSTAGLLGQILTVLLMQPIQLILLAMGIFYLWVYVRRPLSRVETAVPGESAELPIAPTPS